MNQFKKEDIGYLLLLLPAAAIIGVEFGGYFGNNILLILVLALISIIPILVAFNRVPKRFYVVLLYAVSVSLLFQNSLIPNLRIEWADSSWEYYFSSIVLSSGHWNSLLANNINSTLSVVILAPILSSLSNLDISTVFNIFYPLVFSFVPVLIYKIAEKQTNERFAFFSGFLFMSFYTYYTTILGLSRFQIACFFMLLVIYFSFFSTVKGLKKGLIVVGFSLLTIVSHYSVAVIFSIMLIAGWIINHIIVRFLHRDDNQQLIWLDIKPILFFCIASLSWFIFVTKGSVFKTILGIGQSIAENFSSFLNPAKTQGLNTLIGSTTTYVGQYTKFFSLVSIAFITVGLIAVLWKKTSANVSTEYLSIVLASFLLDVLGLAIPNFANSINTDRLFQVNLLCLAPFAIIGCATLFNKLEYSTKKGLFAQKAGRQTAMKVFSIFLAGLLLLNVGFINELANEPISLSLDQRSASYAHKPHFNNQDIAGASWLSVFMGNYSKSYYQAENDYSYSQIDNTAFYYSKIHADTQYAYLIMMYEGFFSPLSSFNGKNIESPILSGEYFFLGTDNVVKGTMGLTDPRSPRGTSISVNITQTNLNPDLELSSKIYDNGQAQIFDYEGPTQEPAR